MPDSTHETAPAAARGAAPALLRSRPVLAVLGTLALCAVPELLPGLERFRVFGTRPPAAAPGPVDRSALSGKFETGEAELKLESRGESRLSPVTAQPRRTRGPIAENGSEPVPELEDKDPKVPIIDPSGSALDGFLRALERTRKKQPGAITRVAHFGDSVIVSDYVSATLRRRLQERFGDAGHGYSLIANAWPAYAHADVERYATSGWKVSRIVGPLSPDGLYGLGCVSFTAEKNTLARFGTAKSGDYGRAVSRYLISYLEQPGGGSFQVSVDGKPIKMVSTAGPEKKAKVELVELSDGAHELELYTKSGRSRLFGVVMERDVPGVVLDALGIQGARLRFLDQQDDAHWAEQLAWRKPDLIVYQFGANESGDGFLYPMKDYRATMEAVIAQGKRALPESSCLVVGAMDRAVKRGDGLIGLAVLPQIVKEQRGAAELMGCAFFDTYAAMGGPGSMASWVKRDLGQADLTHPTAVGAEVIGTWIFRALMKRYRERLEIGAGSLPSNSAPNSNSPSR